MPPVAKCFARKSPGGAETKETALTFGMLYAVVFPGRMLTSTATEDATG